MNRRGFAAGLIVCSMLAAAGAEVPVRGQYRVIDLGRLAGFRSEARGINAGGDIAGLSTSDTGYQAVRWRWDRTNYVIEALGKGEAYGIADDGTVAGLGDSVGGTLWAPGGTPTSLGLDARVNAISGSGRAVGWISAAATNPAAPFNVKFLKHAAFFNGTSPTDLAQRREWDCAVAGVDRAGFQMVGSVVADVFASSRPAHAWLFPGRDLHTLTSFANSFALAVNSSTLVVGYANNINTGPFNQPMFWSEATGMRLLKTPPSTPYGSALGVNDAGQAVGALGSSAVLWLNVGRTNETNVFLNDLLPFGHGWQLQAAYSINNRGEIVGYGLNRDGYVDGFCLVPTNLVTLSGRATVEARDLYGTPTVKAVAGAAIKLNSARAGSVDTVGTQHTDSEGRYSFRVLPEPDTFYALTLTLADQDGRIAVFDHEYDPNHAAWVRTPLFALDASGRADLQMFINVNPPEVRPPPGADPSAGFMNWTTYYLNNAWFIPPRRPAESTVDGSGSNTSARRFAHLAMFYALALEAAEFAGDVLQQSMPLVPIFMNDSAAIGPGKFFSPTTGTIHIEPDQSLFNGSYGDPTDSLRHEYGHAVVHWSPIAGVGSSPPLDLIDVNHHGLLNLTSADSWDEGFATYYAAAVSEWKGETSPERVMLRVAVDLVWDEPRIDNPHLPGRQMSDHGDARPHLLAEEFAIASLLWQVHASTGVETLWATLRRNGPTLNNFKAVFDAFKGDPFITAPFAGLTCNIEATGASASGLDCLFIERGFYFDGNVDGLFDTGEDIGVTRSVRTGDRRTTPPVLPGSEALLRVVAARPDAGNTAPLFRVRIEYDPPRQSRSYEYLRPATGPQPFRLPLLLPAVPSRALVTAFIPGSPALAESAPLVVSNRFFLARVDPDRPGGPADVLLEHTFELDAVAGHDLAVSATAAVTAGGVVPHVAITASIANHGSLRASNVVVMHTLPPGANNVSASASVGTPVISSTHVTLSPGPLAGGDGVNLAIEFDRAPGTMTNRTEVTASGSDANPADNAVVLTTKAVVPPTLVLAAASSSGHRIAFGTSAGCIYVLERTGTLDPPEWTTLAVLPGTGTERVIELPASVDPMAFYRLRIE